MHSFEKQKYQLMPFYIHILIFYHFIKIQSVLWQCCTFLMVPFMKSTNILTAQQLLIVEEQNTDNLLILHISTPLGCRFSLHFIKRSTEMSRNFHAFKAA